MIVSKNAKPRSVATRNVPRPVTKSEADMAKFVLTPEEDAKLRAALIALANEKGEEAYAYYMYDLDGYDEFLEKNLSHDRYGEWCQSCFEEGEEPNTDLFDEVEIAVFGRTLG